MNAPAITMDVRRVGETTAVVDIRGEVTAACEPVLMSAYEAAGGTSTSRLVLSGNTRANAAKASGSVPNDWTHEWAMVPLAGIPSRRAASTRLVPTKPAM